MSDFALGLVGTLVGGAAVAGANVGAAYLVTDAQRDVADINATTQLQLGLAHERFAVLTSQVDLERARLEHEQRLTGIKFLGAGLLLVGLVLFATRRRTT